MRSFKSILVFFFLFFVLSNIVGQSKEYNFTTYAGSEKGFTDGNLDVATFWAPEGIAVDSIGNLYITEYKTGIVRKISTDGYVSVLAGIPNEIGFRDGLGKQALFNRPHGLTVDSKGVVYVCDMKNHCIRKISPSGLVSTLAGIPTVKGGKDGTVLEATFNQPEGIVINSKGHIYVADTYNFTIREISPNGTVSTIAGKSGVAGYQDGIGEKALFNMPIGIAIDKNDILYVVDAKYDGNENGNCIIRRISKNAEVTTYAGIPTIAGNRDGALKKALFHRPVGMAIANDGTMYVADTEADLIRKIDTLGFVTTIGGNYLTEADKDGIGNEASFADPQAIAVNNKGELFIADTFNHKIRKGSKVNNKPIRVFILAGQSNMYGRGDGDKLSNEEISDLKIASNQIQIANNKKYLEPLKIDSVEKFGADKFGIKLGFGPELFFGIELSKKYPNERFLFIKRAAGGTSLYGAWNPLWSAEKACITNELNSPKLYSDFISYISKTLSQYNTNEYKFEGVLWVQGEADSNTNKFGKIPSETYGNNLEQLINSFRSDLKTPELPFLFFQVGSGKVVEGMLETENKLENVIMIKQNKNSNSPDFYEQYPPPLGHYNYNGMKKLGSRFAQEFITNFGIE